MTVEIIHNKIYEIRGHKVMLDYEIAEMFEVLTKALNQAVKRNIERFPEDFMFQLTENEWEMMRSQIVTASELNSSQIVTSKSMRSQFVTASKKRNISALPYAFTEHGVTMLASVLRSEKAVKTSIAIVRAFISMKQYILDRNNISKEMASIKDELAERIDEQDIQILDIYTAIEKLIEKSKTDYPYVKHAIGFKTKTKKTTP